MISLLVTVILLLGNAFFVAAEFALIASRRTVIEPLAATSRRARTAHLPSPRIPDMPASPAPRPDVSRLEQALQARRFVITTEISPPVSFDPGDLIRSNHPVPTTGGTNR